MPAADLQEEIYLSLWFVELRKSSKIRCVLVTKYKNRFSIQRSTVKKNAKVILFNAVKF